MVSKLRFSTFRTFIVATGAVAVTSLAHGANAQVIIRKSTSYFTISGRTAAALDAALAARGPKTENLSRHPGATQIKFTGATSYKQVGGRCMVNQARVNLALNIILPQWTNRPQATPSLALLWDTLSSDIHRHEEHHADIAKQYAQRLEKAISSLPAESDCQKMQAAVTRVTDQQLALHDKDQNAFDRSEAAGFEARILRLMHNHAPQQETASN